VQTATAVVVLGSGVGDLEAALHPPGPEVRRGAGRVGRPSHRRGDDRGRGGHGDRGGAPGEVSLRAAAQSSLNGAWTNCGRCCLQRRTGSAHPSRRAADASPRRLLLPASRHVTLCWSMAVDLESHVRCRAGPSERPCSVAWGPAERIWASGDSRLTTCRCRLRMFC
jgi:hypothetical protein